MEIGKTIDINIRGFWRILTIIFVLAKLYDKIDWTWGTVFIPIYIEMGINFLQAFFKVIGEKAKAKAEEIKKNETAWEKVLREMKEDKS